MNVTKYYVVSHGDAVRYHGTSAHKAKSVLPVQPDPAYRFVSRYVLPKNNFQTPSIVVSWTNGAYRRGESGLLGGRPRSILATDLGDAVRALVENLPSAVVDIVIADVDLADPDSVPDFDRLLLQERQ